MQYLDLGLRNLRRNKRRTFLAVLSISLSILLVVFLNGFIGGAMGSVVKNYTKNETGHVRITTAAFMDRLRFSPVDEQIDAPEDIIARIRAMPQAEDIAMITPRISFGVLLNNEGKSKAAQAMAGDPIAEADLLLLQRGILPGGRYIQGPGETILGKKLAAALGLAVGGELKVLTQASDFSLRLKKFSVVGIFETGSNALDDMVFQIPVTDAQTLLRTGGGVQQILIMLDDYRQSEEIAAAISAMLAGDDGKVRDARGTELVVLPWTAVGEYPRIIEMMSQIYLWVYIVVAFLGAFIVTNIMTMVVLERRKEIGILKALGLKKREILLLFLIEGSLMGLTGSIVGVGIGILLNVAMSTVGVDFGSAMSSLNFPMDPVIYPVVDIPASLLFLVLGTVVASVVSISPSRKAARMQAVEAIKSIA